MVLAFAGLLTLGPAAVLGHSGPREEVATFDGTREYIVLYRKDVPLGARLRNEVRRGNEVEQRFTSSINGALLELEADDVSRLRNDERVLAVDPNTRVSIADSVGISRAAPSWGLDRIDQRSLPLNGQVNTSRRGAGVEAYVIDSGIKFRHREFTGRINPEGFAASGSRVDCYGHGTHVSGTVAGSSFGVAPAARITVVSVLDCAGGGSRANIVAGIDWMISDHRSGEPAVANMSLGGGRSDGDVMMLAVERAVEDGITMVVAAGNDGEEACAHSPAAAASAITVGSTDRTDRMSSFSNYGSCVDLFAPGRDIRSASVESTSASELMSGTSMAAPHVAGAAALLLSAEPQLSPSGVARRLGASATPGSLGALGSCSANLLLYVGSGANRPQPPLERPPSDRFTDRASLPASGVVTGSNRCATHEVHEPPHYVSVSGDIAWDANASIWYEWTAPSDGRVTFDTSGTSFSHMASLYAGSELRNLERLATARSQTGASMTATVTEGTSYSVALDRWWWREASMGSTRLSVAFQPAPANDHFRNAIGIEGSSTVSASSRDATAEPGEPAHHGQQARGSVWYRWTAPADGTLDLSTEGSSFDTVLAVYTGTDVGALSAVASDDDSGGGSASRVSVPVSHGVEYRIAIDGYGGATGAVSLRADFSPPASEEPGQPPESTVPRPEIDLSPLRRSYSRTAVFRFSGSDGATFHCRLNRRRSWTRCSSPIRYRSLARRRHLFRVKQTVGQAVSKPTLFRWRVVRRAR